MVGKLCLIVTCTPDLRRLREDSAESVKFRWRRNGEVYVWTNENIRNQERQEAWFWEWSIQNWIIREINQRSECIMSDSLGSLRNVRFSKWLKGDWLYALLTNWSRHKSFKSLIQSFSVLGLRPLPPIPSKNILLWGESLGVCPRRFESAICRTWGFLSCKNSRSLFPLD